MVRATGTSWLNGVALTLVIPLILSANALAGEVPCPINLGSFGQALHTTLTAQHQILEDDLKRAVLDPKDTQARVARQLLEQPQPGIVVRHRFVFAGNSIFLYREPFAPYTNERPLLRDVVTLNQAVHWEDRLVSDIVYMTDLPGEPLVIAFAIHDHIYLVNITTGKILQTFRTTDHKPVLSVSLTTNYLQAGLDDRIEVFFPNAYPLNSLLAYPAALPLPIPGPAEVLLQSHFTYDEHNQGPLTIAVSNNHLFFFGHSPTFDEVLPFPTATVSGPITDAIIADFTVANSRLLKRVAMVRVHKNDQVSKLQAFHTSNLSKLDSSQTATQLASKTVPGTQILPHFTLVAIQTPAGKIQLILALSDSEDQTGLLIGSQDDGRLQPTPLAPNTLHPKAHFNPQHIPR